MSGHGLTAWQVDVIERLYAWTPEDAAAVLDLMARVNELSDEMAMERDEVEKWASTYRGGPARRSAGTASDTVTCARRGRRT